MYFWLDWWCGNGPLPARFPLLFSCCANPFITVQGTRVIGGTPGEWRVLFRRQMDLLELVECDNLCREVQGLPIEVDEDTVTWALEPLGQFSNNSMYMCLLQGETVTCFKEVWKVRVPPKIKIFLWQLIHNRLPSCK
jgi:hypothetical protein